MTKQLTKLSNGELDLLSEQIEIEIIKRRAIALDKTIKAKYGSDMDVGRYWAEVVKAPAESDAFDTVVEEAASEKPKAKPKKKGDRRTLRKGQKVEPKYQHPNDSSLTWTGRGRKPVWVTRCLDNGYTMDELEIGGPAHVEAVAPASVSSTPPNLNKSIDPAELASAVSNEVTTQDRPPYYDYEPHSYE